MKRNRIQLGEWIFREAEQLTYEFEKEMIYSTNSIASQFVVIRDQS